MGVLVDAATAAEQQISDLTAQVTQTQGELTTARRNNARLRNALAECQGAVEPPPPPPPPTLAIGYEPDPNTIAEFQKLAILSGAEVRRTYKSPGGWPNTPDFLGDEAAGLITAHTIKCPVPSGTADNMKNRLEYMLSGKDDENHIKYIMRTQKDSIIGHEHEPEDDFKNGRWDWALYPRAQVKGRALMDEANKRDGGTRRYSGNLMSDTHDETYMDDLLPPEGIWDILGWDGYNWPNRVSGSTTVPAWRELGDLMAGPLAQSQRYGAEFAIFETGCRKANLLKDVQNMNLPTDEFAAKQADWCAKGRKWLIEVGKPEIAVYFHHDWWLMKENGHRAWGGKV